MTSEQFTEDELTLLEDWCFSFLDNLDGYRYEKDLAESILGKVQQTLDD